MKTNNVKAFNLLATKSISVWCCLYNFYLKTKESHLWYILSCSYLISVEFDLPRLSIWLTYFIARLLFPAILICCSRNWWICLLTSSCWSYSPRWWWLYILTFRSLKFKDNKNVHSRLKSKFSPSDNLLETFDMFNNFLWSIDWWARKIQWETMLLKVSLGMRMTQIFQHFHQFFNFCLCWFDWSMIEVEIKLSRPVSVCYDFLKIEGSSLLRID